MYATKFIFTEYDIDIDDLRKVLTDIRLKDNTFRFSIYKMKDGKYLLNIYSNDEDTAHKRGAWVWDKIFTRKVGYKVVKV